MHIYCIHITQKDAASLKSAFIFQKSLKFPKILKIEFLLVIYLEIKINMRLKHFRLHKWLPHSWFSGYRHSNYSVRTKNTKVM